MLADVSALTSTVHAGRFCEGCACRNCQNVDANQAVVLHMRQQILARSPNAFDVKVHIQTAYLDIIRQSCGICDTNGLW